MNPRESNSAVMFVLAFAWLILGWFIWVPLALAFGWQLEPVAVGGFVALITAAVVSYIIEGPERRRRNKDDMDRSR